MLVSSIFSFTYIFKRPFSEGLSGKELKGRNTEGFKHFLHFSQTFEKAIFTQGHNNNAEFVYQLLTNRWGIITTLRRNVFKNIVLKAENGRNYLIVKILLIAID